MKKDFWAKAQQYEEQVWREWGDEPMAPLRRRAEIMFSYLFLNEPNPSDSLKMVALEVGGAGAPVIPLLDFKTRYVVDPILDTVLEKFPSQYASQNGDTFYHAKPAEDLSFVPDGSVDAAFCLNVLDHTERPNLILQEMARKLLPNGRLLLSVDCYSIVWLLLRAARVAIKGNTTNDILHLRWSHIVGQFGSEVKVYSDA